MVTHLLEFGGFIFWGIVGVVSLFDFMALGTEDDGWTAWAMTFTIGLVIFTFGFTDAGLHLADKIALIGCIAASYFCLGVCWAFKKWIDFIVAKKQFAKETYGDNFKDRMKVPLATDNKQLIISWMILWPWSFAWWAFTWPRHAFVWAYNHISVQLDAIAASIWSK